MKPQTKPNSLPAKPDAPAAPDQRVHSFRTFLHLAVTASRVGGPKALAAVSGSSMHAHCRALAGLPDNTLALELSAAAGAILGQLQAEAAYCERLLFHGTVTAPQEVAQVQHVLEQLDLALAFLLRNGLAHTISARAEATGSADLLCEATQLAIGDGVRAARLIRRGMAMTPPLSPAAEDVDIEDAGFQRDFAWDAYRRVAALDRLADEFPAHVRWAARAMHAWPMLVHRHTDNRRRFIELARHLELGEDYPTDASEGACYRPDTPMVRYLDAWILRLHEVRCEAGWREFKSAEAEREQLRRLWWEWPKPLPAAEVVDLLYAAVRLPPLTKATAKTWAETALVPLILATDARDAANCSEPVLRRIWNQKGVKSRATFKSRLRSAVTATLRRLARVG
jgi:hypothetical protein